MLSELRPCVLPQVLGLLAFGTGWDGALSGGLRIPEPAATDDTAKQVRLRSTLAVEQAYGDAVLSSASAPQVFSSWRPW
jgi:hypothetical protein